MARTVACVFVLLIALSTIRCGNGDGVNFAPSVPSGLNGTETFQPGAPNTWDLNFTWAASIDLEGNPVEYFAELYQTAAPPTFPFDFGSATLYADSGWISALNWAVTGAPELFFYVLRVKARDASSESDWGVLENDMLGSCPFLFVWDGDKYAFESDVFPGARLGTPRGGGNYLRPHPIDYYVLTKTPALKDGAYEIQLTGERDEVDYVDEVQLLALYHPDTTQVFAERAPLGVSSFPGIERLHTVNSLTAPVSARHVNTGADVTAAVGAMDGTYITLNEDANEDFEYQTLELDLGDLSQAQQIKLIIDGQSVFPNTPEGAARAAQFGPTTRVEIPDGNGGWAQVPRSVVNMPNVTGFRRVIVVEVTDAFQTNDFRIRLTWLFKSFLDAILIDTSVDEPILALPLPLLSADLHYRGFSSQTLGERYELAYDHVSTTQPEYFPGAYTRYGDVEELLTAPDDRFVIFFGGDEITLRFAAAPPPGAGQLLGFALMTNGYYKDPNIPLPATVDPLPFAGMSNYPYDPATEKYPDDAFHTDYLRTWNTRVR